MKVNNQIEYKIFQKRVRDHLTSLSTFYKRSIDWIVWIYLILPASVISIYYYIQWWTDPELLNMQGVHLILFGILFFVMLFGNIRFFIERADQLFFRQFETSFQRLKFLGLIYSIVIQGLLLALTFMIFAPIMLVQMKMSLALFVWLYLFIWIGSVMYPAGKQLIQYHFAGWRLHLFVSILNVCSLIVYSVLLYVHTTLEDVILLILTFILFLILAVLLVFPYVNKRGTFQEDLAKEMMLKYRFTSLALQSAGLIGAPQFQRLKPLKGNKRPWFFRHSGTIFTKRTPENALIELYLKYLIRDKNKWILMVQMMNAFIFAIIIVPSPLKWVMWGAALFLFSHLNYSFLASFEKRTFLKTFDWSQEKMLLYSVRCVWLTNLPFMFLIGAVSGGLLFSDVWWMFFGGGMMTVAISYVIQPFFRT